MVALDGPKMHTQTLHSIWPRTTLTAKIFAKIMDAVSKLSN